MADEQMSPPLEDTAIGDGHSHLPPALPEVHVEQEHVGDDFGDDDDDVSEASEDEKQGQLQSPDHIRAPVQTNKSLPPSPVPELVEDASRVRPPSLPVQSPSPTGNDAPPPSSSASISAATARTRTDSSSTAATTDTRGSSTRSSLVFVVGALESIGASKDAQRRKDLKDAVQNALAIIKAKGDPQQIDPRILLHPLRLATEASTESVVTTALDCIGKLISYSYFSVPTESQSEDEESLIDQAIDTICDCFEGEATPDRVQLQIIISLLAAVLNDKVVVHGAGLLKAVRQMYNIFLHSKNTRNQQVAQGTLTQMVGTVFERAKARAEAKEGRARVSKVATDEDAADGINNGNIPDVTDDSLEDTQDQEEMAFAEDVAERPDVPVEKEGGAKMTLQTFERRGSFDEDRLKEGPTMVTKLKSRTGDRSRSADGNLQEQNEMSDEDDEDEVYMKDAFLVFRAMCKISIKSLRAEELADLRSQGMRTKLLSLHIIHNVLFNHTAVFLSPFATIRNSSSNEATPFTQAIKQLLCQSLSRNGASSVQRVFEVGCEIFWIMLKHLRVLLKKEVEVFLKEIYLAILDSRTAPIFQKECFLNVLERLAAEPRALVEIYLNYDCDRTASDNMFQRIVENLSKLASSPVAITSIQQHAYQTSQTKRTHLHDWQTKGTVPPALTTATMGVYQDQETAYPAEYAMKQQSLESMIETLRSLVHWSQQGVIATPQPTGRDDSKLSTDHRDSADFRASSSILANYSVAQETPPGTPKLEDDPSTLEQAKKRKTALLEAVRQFNFKPKRGIKTLLEAGFIKSKDPEDIARFLITNEQIDKASLGEFLGEGEPENVAIMHAFVDTMDFTKTRFVDALRRYLQSFRLPGEAQKIDRFVLKFAERYISGNPNAFANADTAYVLSYSVILLNTDLHSAKMKGKRMTLEEFIKNNRGINDNADLPEDYLGGIYDEIAHNEIVLDTERKAAANMGYAQQPTGGFTTNIGQAFAGRDLQKEAYLHKSEEMANKTEQLFKSLIRAQRRTTNQSLSKFIPATSFRHVGPMFDVTWMPFLTALSGCAQDTSNLETVKLCMDGLRLAIQIACFFDLENPRMAFVASIARFTNLYNLSEMQAKNVEALRVLLDIAFSEGNALKESWRDVLTCISQLDRFQLISGGVPERAVPDVLKAQQAQSKTLRQRGTLAPPERQRPRAGREANYRSDVAEESRSNDIVYGVDRIFTSTSRLTGDAIVHFVKALTQVSWQEIQSSGQSQDPRTYSLQKLVEVSEYNMGRVRFEWTNIWQVLGDHFNQVGCHTNTKVVHFALNSLRQLSIRFLGLEELPGFKFQKDFLKPFEHIIGNTGVVQVKEIVLHSLIQMIAARGDNIRSGWRTIFGVFTVAGRERYEGVVNLAYDHVMKIYSERLGIVITQGAFADLIVCLTEFAKNSRFQKKSLQAIEALKSTVPAMLRTPECPLSQKSSHPFIKQPTRQTQEEQFWFPVLFAFYDILMTGDDLEVRSRALNYLFDILIKHGKGFPREFWDTIWRQLLYQIFMVLKNRTEMSRVVNHEELSVWLSTTMIQALRNMMSLFTHHFESLEYMLDRFLDLLALCICQENDTLARIGSNCLQTLILQNVDKFTNEQWSKIVSSFVDLFARTEATALFSAAAASYGSAPSVNGQLSEADADALGDLNLSEPNGNSRSLRARSINSRTANDEDISLNTVSQAGPPAPPAAEASVALEDYRPEPQMQQAPVVVTAARRRFFNHIITKCVLQLLMIETVNELFSNDNVYSQIPSKELLRLMALLKKSYQFAKRFNDDWDLRNKLFQEGFMKQPPNLLKQESGSASVYVNILFRMYHDQGEERQRSNAETEAALIPLCVDIVAGYLQLKEDTQQRNIVTWRPVVMDVIDGYANFPSEGFAKHAATFAPLTTALMNRDMGMDLQRAVQALIHRILELHYEMPPLDPAPPTPMSPRASVFGGGARRQSYFSRSGTTSNSSTTLR